MAINKVDYPANLTDQADFSAHGTLIEGRYLDQSAVPLQVISGNIPQGVVFQIGGVVYRADSDTAITGTASDYVKITPAGATASAAYVASLTGVTWSAQYNGYYDASGNLYIFDEGKALAAGEITAVFGRYLAQQANGDVQVGRNLDVAGDAAVGGTVNGMTDAEMSQIEKIGTTVISATQWTYLGNLDQNLQTTSDVTHLNVTATDRFLGGAKEVTGYLHGTSLSGGSIFTAMSSAIPTVGDTMILTGYLVQAVGDNCNVARAVRATTLQIDIYGWNVSSGLVGASVISGGSLTFNASIAW